VKRGTSAWLDVPDHLSMWFRESESSMVVRRAISASHASDPYPLPSPSPYSFPASTRQRTMMIAVPLGLPLTKLLETCRSHRKGPVPPEVQPRRRA
jgi:hypothetical protein